MKELIEKLIKRQQELSEKYGEDFNPAVFVCDTRSGVMDELSLAFHLYTVDGSEDAGEILNVDPGTIVLMCYTG